MEVILARGDKKKKTKMAGGDFFKRKNFFVLPTNEKKHCITKEKGGK